MSRFAYARSFDEDSAREYIRDINVTRRERGEAILLAFDWARSLGFERMEAETDVANVAAQAAMEAAGFTREGVARGFNPGPSGRVDYARFGRLATDPVPARP